jgi:hypothetical protein
MKVIKPKKDNLSTPGEPMSEGKFQSLIEEAEQSVFKPATNLKKEVLSTWRKKYSK